MNYLLNLDLVRILQAEREREAVLAAREQAARVAHAELAACRGKGGLVARLLGRPSTACTVAC